MAPEDKSRPNRIILGGNSKDQKLIRELQGKLFDLEKQFKELKTDVTKLDG